MTTESEAKIARYGERKKEADALGRVITVRRLKPSEQMKLAGLTPDLNGVDEVSIVDEKTGEEKIQPIPQRLPLIITASVCDIDGIPIPFPRSRGELDAIYDRLDVEGVTAATKALGALNGVDTKADDAPTAEEEAKN